MASGIPASGVLWFDEDFDLPPAATEPEVIEPVFSAAELLAAREAAAEDSRDRALAEAEQSTRAQVGRALTEIASQLAGARDEAAAIAEQSAETIARLLMDCFATAFPALSARHGAGELAAVLRGILPTLRREPKISVRVNPDLVPAAAQEIQALDADLAARVRVIPAEAMAMGDAQVTWEQGAAIRDTMSLWNHIESILAPAGLLSARRTTKEHELVE